VAISDVAVLHLAGSMEMQGARTDSVGESPREPPKTPKALDLAADLVKQVITLSTAVMAFTATFAKQFSPPGKGIPSVPGALKYSWIFFIVAIFFGIMMLMTIVGTANRIEASQPSAGTNSPNVRLFGGLTMTAFFIALALTITAGFSTIR
jgi:hypothetical protein